MARPKKVVTEKPKETTKQTFSKEEINAALEILHSEYFLQTVGLLSHDSGIKELNYIKVPITTPDGGLYLVSILHIDGPKVDLQRLAKAAETFEQSKIVEDKK
jgi:hypothetical protein